VEKLEVAAISLGIATAAFDDAWTYSQQRMQFGKAISAYQAIRTSWRTCRRSCTPRG